jgi:hypothetical protein
MKFFVFSLALAFVFTAEASSTCDFKIGHFTKLKQIPNEDASIYSRGCQQPGSMFSLQKLDSRIQAGMSYRGFDYSVNEKNELMCSEHTSKVLSIQDNNGSKMMSIQNKVLQSAGLSFNPVGTNYGITYTDSQGTSMPDFWNIGSQINDNGTCGVKNSADSRNSEVSWRGIYQFADGKKVLARMVTYLAYGKISCNGVEMESGVDETTWIFSEEVPALETPNSYCGGTSIDQKWLSTGDSGKIYHTHQFGISSLGN